MPLGRPLGRGDLYGLLAVLGVSLRGWQGLSLEERPFKRPESFKPFKALGRRASNLGGQCLSELVQERAGADSLVYLCTCQQEVAGLCKKRLVLFGAEC